MLVLALLKSLHGAVGKQHGIVHPEPFEIANTPVVAFFRFLHLLSTWPFDQSPLLVDVNEERVGEDTQSLFARFSAARKTGTGAPLFLVTPTVRIASCIVSLRVPTMLSSQDRGAWLPKWSQQKPTVPVLGRLAQFAQQSLTLFTVCFGPLAAVYPTSKNRSIPTDPWMLQLEEQQFSWKANFVTSFDDYDILIKLRPEVVPGVGSSATSGKGRRSFRFSLFVMPS